MKKTYIFLAIIALAAPRATAQQTQGLDRRVEVTRAYTPDIDAAVKLSTVPRMEDTVALRPDISYAIRPAAWQTAFGVRPIAAARIDARVDRPQPMLYAKVGMGAPLQSLADIYFHRNADRTSFGAYVNHYGQYGDIENDLPVATWTPATWSTNRIGAYIDQKTGERTSLGAEIRYDWNYYTRYGLATPPAGGPVVLKGKTSQSIYSSPAADVQFGNDFTDLSRLNFCVKAGAAYFADRQDNSETSWHASLGLGRAFGANRLTLQAGLRGFSGGGDILGDYRNTIFDITPLYGFENEKLKVTFGFDFALDNLKPQTSGDSSDDNAKTRFFPKLDIHWDVARGYFVPFVTIDGGLQNNGMKALATVNPYTAQGSAANKNTARYDMMGGISGSFSSAFAYKVYGGATVYRSLCHAVYLYDNPATGTFRPGTQDVLQFTIGGDLSARVAEGLEALLNAQFHIYPDNTTYDKAAGLPDLEMGIGARYSLRNRLILGAGIDLIGNRYFYAMYPGGTPFLDVKANPAADLHLEAEYRFPKFGSVFLEARNLLNNNLYPYNHYRGPGINALAGVKITF